MLFVKYTDDVQFKNISVSRGKKIKSAYISLGSECVINNKEVFVNTSVEIIDTMYTRNVLARNEESCQTTNFT